MKVCRVPVRVYYEDTDAAGVVYYANYLRFIERARTDWLRGLGFDQATLLATDGIAFAVRKVEADYLRPARLDDMLTATAEVESVGGVRIVFRQGVLRGDETLFTAKVTVVCFDPVTARPAAIPADILQAFQPDNSFEHATEAALTGEGK